MEKHHKKGKHLAWWIRGQIRDMCPRAVHVALTHGSTSDFSCPRMQMLHHPGSCHPPGRPDWSSQLPGPVLQPRTSNGVVKQRIEILSLV